MKAAFIHRPGPPGTIVFGDLPQPTPGPTQCLVRVGAVSVNPVDTYIRGGMIPMPIPSPFVVGCDLAGTVAGVGAEVTRFETGDRVWGSNQGLLGRQGTFSEFAVVDECWLYPTPKNVRDEDAAALALVGITAHLGLVREVGLAKGEVLLVNGGSGGVGSTVIQVARALGARVIATAGTEAKRELCRKLGAELALDYRSADLEVAVRKVAPAGVNVWWESTREPDFDRAVSCMAARGRLVLMAGREARPPFPVGPFYVKGCSLHGFVMFAATADEQEDCAEDLNAWMAGGRIRPHIDRVMHLSQAAEAHQLQEDATIRKSGALSGKLVLKP